MTTTLCALTHPTARCSSPTWHTSLVTAFSGGIVLEQIMGEHEREMRTLRSKGVYSDTVERKLEEAFCDLFSAKLLGVAYLYSFLYSVWPMVDSSQSEEYPTPSFRLRCITDLLEVECQDFEKDLPLSDEWKKEDIRWALEDFVEEARKQVPIGPKRLVELFCESWRRVAKKESGEFRGALLEESNSIMEELLEGGSVSPHT